MQINYKELSGGNILESIKESQIIKDCSKQENALFNVKTAGFSELDSDELSDIQIIKARAYLAKYPNACGVTINIYKDDEKHQQKISIDRRTGIEYNFYTFSFDYMIKDYSPEVDEFFKNNKLHEMGIKFLDQLDELLQQLDPVRLYWS